MSTVLEDFEEICMNVKLLEATLKSQFLNFSPPKCGNHANRRKHINHSNNMILGNYKVKGKGEGRPVTGYEDAEAEQRYSCTLSLTSALDGSGWSTPRPGRFTLGKDPVPIYIRVGEPQNRSGRV